MKKHSIITSTVLAFTLIGCTSVKAESAPSSTFSDVSSTNWAYSTIEWGAKQGIVSGYNDGTFKPNNKVSEAEFLAMIFRTSGEKKSTSGGESWYEQYYDLATQYNYPVSGKASEPITRQQVAEIIVGTQGYNFTGNDAIQFILAKGIAKGKTSTTIIGYKGSDTLTRAEAVAFIQNVKVALKGQKLMTRPISLSPMSDLPLLAIDQSSVSSDKFEMTVPSYNSAVYWKSDLDNPDLFHRSLYLLTKEGETKLYIGTQQLTEFFYYEGRYYFLGANADSIMSIKTDGSDERIEFDEQQIFKLVGIDDGWIYFIHMDLKDNDLNYYFPSFNRYNLTSHETQLICNYDINQSGAFDVKDGWIYFDGQLTVSSAKSKGRKAEKTRGIYRVKPNNTELKLVTSKVDLSSKIEIVGDRIYYLDQNEKNYETHIFSVDLDGNNKKQIDSDESLENFWIKDNKIFYIKNIYDDSADYKEVYSIDLDGGHKKRLIRNQWSKDGSAFVSIRYAVVEDKLYVLKIYYDNSPSQLTVLDL